MKVLIIKTSSIGDILHTLPALTDAARQHPGIQFDWVVEESCVEIPAWHPNVRRVIPVALRRWRKSPLKTLFSGELRTLWRTIRAEKYDCVIDAQGLTKSALVARMAKGRRYGLDRKSARDPVAFIHYHQAFSVSWKIHAVTRIRQLFANALGYALPTTPPDSQIQQAALAATPFAGKYLVFVQGASWDTKLYPEAYWRELAQIAMQAGYSVYLNSGSPTELARAQSIVADIKDANAMPRKNFAELASILQGASGVIAIDTGLGHLTAALAKPAVSLYGATSAAMTGAHGMNQIHIQSQYPCSPCFSRSCNKPAVNNVTPACFAEITPVRAWEQLIAAMQQAEAAKCA